MNTIDKPAIKNKCRKSYFFVRIIKVCTPLLVILTLSSQVVNAQSIKVLTRETESLIIQNEGDVSQAQEKNIVVKQPDNAELSSIGDIKDWMLMLVNGENPLPDNYSPNLKKLNNGLEFDERAIDQLNAMLSAAKSQGLSPIVCSAYRSIERQKILFNNQVYKYMAEGFGQEQAEIEARKYVAYPRTSEHNLGLAVDIVSINYQMLDEKQANTPETKWLIEHCSEYGFILRYPKDKIHTTGVAYEPWHFRYVGVQAAQEIMKDSITLEEYLMYK